MYLRRSVVRKNGKTHTYRRLVKSVRHGSKVRQVTVATLGKLTAKERRKASSLARHFLGSKAHQLELFEDIPAPETAEIQLDRVRVERSRAFGDVYLAWVLWRALGLEDFCHKHVPRGRERVSWAEVIAILVIARFCEPSSELHIAEDWYAKTALEDVLGIRQDLVHSERLYRGLDRLLTHKDGLQKHLKNRQGELFELDYELLLYDVTSTYFEGQAKGNAKAKRGHSRDMRPDCKQVCIGLVVTKDGYPLGYEVFAGNRIDVTTVEEIVETMEERYGVPQRVWVMDRGMVSEANLEWLREGGRKYLVGTPKSELKKFEKDLVEKRGWKKIRDGIEVKICKASEGEETFILCRSEDQELKEAAMHDRFSDRMKEGLSSLCRRIEKSKKILDPLQISEQIGRLKQRNSRAAGKFSIEIKDDNAKPAGVKVVWKERKSWSQWAKLTEGAYLLRTNVEDWSSEELWRTYVQLTDVEEAFRIQKHDLKIRPVWHQREDRVEAHILVCFLAYVMWKTLAGWQERAGIGSSPRTLLGELKKINSVDVVLPVVDGPELRLRCVLRPDPDQAMLLDRLGIRLPDRLSSHSLVDKM